MKRIRLFVELIFGAWKKHIKIMKAAILRQKSQLLRFQLVKR